MELKRFLELENMPDANRSMERIEAWFTQEMLDRAPIRFNIPDKRAGLPPKQYTSLKERWFDYEYIVEDLLCKLKGKRFIGETFPMWFPNLGPGIYAAYYGTELVFQENTSYTVPNVTQARAAQKLRFDCENIYFRQIDKMMRYALERCQNRLLIGYPDLHPGMDCVADWLDPQELCFQLVDDPEGVEIALEKAEADFEEIYNHYDSVLKACGQPSFGWLHVPVYGRIHIPSCDFSAMVSPEVFQKFCLPPVIREMRTMTHNIWHLDGPGCARHLDDLLEIEDIQAFQWVQGAGSDAPVLQWVPLIKKIQASGKSVMVSMTQEEFEPFLDAVSPKGMFLCVDAPNEEVAENMLRKIEKWI